MKQRSNKEISNFRPGTRVRYLQALVLWRQGLSYEKMGSALGVCTNRAIEMARYGMLIELLEKNDG